MRVGVEVGGTFTDLIAVRDGEYSVVKVPSTPAFPEQGAINALNVMPEETSAVTDLVHGSTVATNAVLERKGARVGLLVTEGTRDVLAIQRHERTAIYDLNYQKPRPLVDRQDIAEIDERIGADGEVLTPVDETSARTKLRPFLDNNYDVVAICLLNSYLNPAHEQQVAKLVGELSPGTAVTCSTEISPEFREYERMSTTALAAYVQPAIDRYLTTLVDTLRADGFTGSFSVMQSNGGRMPAHTMGRHAVSALYSGPAAGVVGAAGVAAGCGFQNIVTLDMGGTSTDVALVVDGQLQIASQTRVDGLPVRVPVTDISTVGAGGGSIAWVDDGGLLRVGPESAGAMPGPAAYGHGGQRATVTDAHLVRGTIRPDSFLGGRMKLDLSASSKVVNELARQIDSTAAHAADAVIQLAQANIVRAIQHVSTERGFDPRDFVLVPFGGAGGLHAARVAQDLGILKILVPQNSGVLSAVGLLMADYRIDRSRTEPVLLGEKTIGQVRDTLNTLIQESQAYVEQERVPGEPVFDLSLEMRYAGQAFELTVPVGQDPGGLTVDKISGLFAAAHHRVFEFSKPPDKAVEVVTMRVSTRVATGSPGNLGGAVQDHGADVQCDILESGESHQCKVTSRGGLPQEEAARVSGPLLIEDETSTTYVPPEWSVFRDNAGNMYMQFEDAS